MFAAPFGIAGVTPSSPLNALKNAPQSGPPQLPPAGPAGGFGEFKFPSAVSGVGGGPAHDSDERPSSYGPVIVRLPSYTHTSGFGKKKPGTTSVGCTRSRLPLLWLVAPTGSLPSAGPPIKYTALAAGPEGDKAQDHKQHK